MQQFLGEFECKIDAKGRMRLPSMLLKQMEGQERGKYVVNRGFEKCLVLYPINEWNKITKDINQLNLYVKKNRDFVRYFYRGATEMMPDSADRVLLPKRLMEYAGLGNEVVVFAYFNRIELWAKEEYESLLDDEPMDFSELAEDVMGQAKESGDDIS